MDIEPTDMDMGLVRLIADCGLPVGDLQTPGQRARIQAFVAPRVKAPEGVVAIERFGRHGLLRSLAVHPVHQGKGLGGKLLLGAERWAREQGIEALYLLTTTAEAFFRARGYVPQPRAAAPEAIRTSPQYSSICPASAAFLGRCL